MTPKLHGLDAETAEKMKRKYDPEREREAVRWVSEVIHRDAPPPNPLEYGHLRDGSVLCRLLNALLPATVPSYAHAPRHRLEAQGNILAYLRGCRSIGVTEEDLFDVRDLLDDRFREPVIVNIYAVAREAQVC